jgi:hypothetical protein
MSKGDPYQKIAQQLGGDCVGMDARTLKCNGQSGAWFVLNSPNVPMNGKHMVVDMVNLMIGWRRLMKGTPIEYVLGLVRDGYEPPPRETLGDTDRDSWEYDSDPWQRAYVAPLFDVETKETLIYVADNQTSHYTVNRLSIRFGRSDKTKLPLVVIGSRLSTGRKEFYYPELNFMDWVERPAELRVITPPAPPLIESRPMKLIEARPDGNPPVDDSIPF